MSIRQVSLREPAAGISEESSEVLEKPSGDTLAAEESGTDVSEQRAGGRRMNAALWQKWGNVRSKLRSMGCVLVSNITVIPWLEHTHWLWIRPDHNSLETCIWRILSIMRPCCSSMYLQEADAKQHSNRLVACCQGDRHS